MPSDVSQPVPGLSAARNACAEWFGAAPVEVGPLSGPGFSGAAPTRVRPRGAAAWHVLKPFAAGTPRDRAEWIHGLARHLADSGVAEVRRPLATPRGGTVVADGRGVLWEMMPFVEGVATASPGPARAAAAAAMLARVHVAAAALPGALPRPGRSAGAARRISGARDLLARSWRIRRESWAAGGAFAARLDRAIAIFETSRGDRAVAAVAAAREDDVTVQAVLRDVWSEHVLFAAADPPRVAGIVDLHAAGIDAPATDLARMLGSWRRAGAADANPLRTWPEAVAAYEGVRPLDEVERRLVPFLHAAGVVCGLDNWFRWTLDDGRTFPDAATVRVDRLLEDLPAALEWLAERGPGRV
ncbi:MAG: phosphotransferase [Planctomycetaceae bacterium]